MRRLTDQEILKLMKSDDTRGLEEAMAKYSALVGSIAAKMLDSPSDCEEAVSDTFFKLWRYRLVIDTERRSFKGFLCMVAKSCASDKLRSLNRIKRQEVIPPEENDIGIDVDYEDAAAKRHNQRLITDCVSSMPSPDREVFIDRYYFNMPIRDIALKEGLKEKKVERILYKGKLRLKEALIKGGILL